VGYEPAGSGAAFNFQIVGEK